MPISSRTPEGTPNMCPVCGHEFRLEPSVPPGDAPCPACGALLWFTSSSHRRQAVASGLVGVGSRAVKLVLAMVALAISALVLFAVGLALAKAAHFYLGFPESVIVTIVAVILFGRRLPDVGRWLGKRCPL